MLVQSAFNLQDYEVAGVPGWVSSQWFEINAVPPETSPSRNIKLRNAEPTSEQASCFRLSFATASASNSTLK
jgi:uncharacterized protein (TIGR03435 family)